MAALARTHAAHDEREHEQQKCLCGTERQAGVKRETKNNGDSPQTGLWYRKITYEWAAISKTPFRSPLSQGNNVAPVINMLKKIQPLEAGKGQQFVATIYL